MVSPNARSALNCGRNVRIHRIDKVTKWLFSSIFLHLFILWQKTKGKCPLLPNGRSWTLWMFVQVSQIMTKIWKQRLFAYKIFSKSSCAFGSDLIWAIILHHPICTTVSDFFLRFFFYFHSLFFVIQFITKKICLFRVWTESNSFMFERMKNIFFLLCSVLREERAKKN